MTSVLHRSHVGATKLLPGQTGFLAGLSTANISTPLVAFTRGVAGMLVLETKASWAIAVAISVTTIPASAHLGFAAGAGEASKSLLP